ncbi:hypothetical protein FBU59_000145 [Linderina macrospora]|uniref:Uncharacterized protein n=1 Tax=Linderina macrospora TaxID=4868 RepID=A0ACC1JHP4_9FUNG|nr:hypothetical protein FBU59_000145 [Linderina macrospora]
MRYTFSSLPRATSQPVIACTLPGDDAATPFRLYKWVKSKFPFCVNAIIKGTGQTVVHEDDEDITSNEAAAVVIDTPKPAEDETEEEADTQASSLVVPQAEENGHAGDQKDAEPATRSEVPSTAASDEHPAPTATVPESSDTPTAIPPPPQEEDTLATGEAIIHSTTEEYIPAATEEDIPATTEQQPIVPTGEAAGGEPAEPAADAPCGPTAPTTTENEHVDNTAEVVQPAQDDKHTTPAPFAPAEDTATADVSANDGSAPAPQPTQPTQ